MVKLTLAACAACLLGACSIDLPAPSSLAGVDGTATRRDGSGAGPDGGVADADGARADGATDGSAAIEIPAVYLSGAELAALGRVVIAGREPWAGAFVAVKTAADTALTQKNRSVTDNGGGRAFASDSPSGPSPDRGDYLAGLAVTDRARDLALTWRVSGEARYADKAVALLRAWATDPTTGMLPQAHNAGPATSGASKGSAIEIYLVLPGVFYAASLLWDYDGWARADRDAFVTWARTITADAASKGGSGGAHELFRLVAIAAGGALLNDAALRLQAFDAFKKLLPSELGSDSSFGSNDLGSSTFALNAAVQLAEIARHYGVDLYDFSVQGRSLRGACDYYAPFVAKPSTWSGTRGSLRPALFEMVYSVTRDAAHRAAVSSGRPHDENYIVGPVTLTHGERFTW